MSKLGVMGATSKGTDGQDIDIFRAALLDDVSEMARAISQGQTINDIEKESGMNAVHIAAWNGSLNFMAVAVNDPIFDPWIRDPSGNTAFQYASSRNDREMMRILGNAMYPYGGQNPVPSQSPER